MNTFKVGQTVVALGRIYDHNDGSPDDPIRAESGHKGIVEDVSAEGFPTVRFEGGATIVSPDEIEAAE